MAAPHEQRHCHGAATAWQGSRSSRASGSLFYRCNQRLLGSSIGPFLLGLEERRGWLLWKENVPRWVLIDTTLSDGLWGRWGPTALAGKQA